MNPASGQGTCPPGGGRRLIDHGDWIQHFAHKLDPRLQREMRQRERTIRTGATMLHRAAEPWHQRRPVFRTIVCLTPGAPGHRLETVRALVEKHGGVLRRSLKLIGGFGATLSLKAAQELVSTDYVGRIALDAEVRALLDVAAPSIGVPLAWDEGRTGKGVTIAVIDTGVYPHPDFTQPEHRIRAFVDFVGEKSRPYDDNGHGTHVAGCAVGNGLASNGKYRGPAFEAGLVALKALDRSGAGRASDIIAAMEWAVQNRSRFNIRVLSLSLGGDPEVPYQEDPLAQAAEQAWDAGLVVCAAAGNAGPAPRTISTPGTAPKVITIGAMDDRGTADRADDVIAPFSGRGPTADGRTKPDLLAPGANITGPRGKGSQLDREMRGGSPDYLTLSGTSMATPIVAGFAALLLQHEPQLTPDQVKRRLMSLAENRGYAPDAQGAGYVQFENATDRRGKR